MTMMRGFLVAAMAAVLAGLFSWNASAARAAADADSASCSIRGSAVFYPDVTEVPASHVFSFALTWSCSGIGDESGSQTLNFIGNSTQSCSSGSGTAPSSTGTIEGSAVTQGSAVIAMTQSMNQFSFSGTVANANGETHHVSASITVANPNLLLCPYTGDVQYPASGNGTLADA